MLFARYIRVVHCFSNEKWQICDLMKMSYSQLRNLDKEKIINLDAVQYDPNCP